VIWPWEFTAEMWIGYLRFVVVVTAFYLGRMTMLWKVKRIMRGMCEKKKESK